MQRFIAHLRIENYQGMVAGIALKHWKRLPKSTKVWIDADDFVNDGLMFARVKVLPYFDVKTAAFSTILTIMLEQFFMRTVDSYRRQKRTPVEIPIPKPQLIVDKVMNHQALVQLYWQSSPLLREYLFSWFFSSGVDRIRESLPFKKARKEFLKLAPIYGVTPQIFSSLLERRQTVLVDNEIQYPEDEI